MERLAQLTPREKLALRFNWEYWYARPNQQLPPGEWVTWLILAGRGFGKTRTGAETVRKWIRKYPYVNLIGATTDDARSIMIEGESGIMEICPRDERPIYKAQHRTLYWPNGAKSQVFTADEPDRMRGKQHMKGWADELCFVAGTMVQNEHGPKPIELISAGEFVQTRSGLRRVNAAWQSNPCADVLRLMMSDNRTIIGTANHPIFVNGKSFIPLHLLKHGDMMETWEQNKASCLEQPTHERFVALKNVETITVSSIEKLPFKAAVYNISVDGEEEYYANGILVHNCAWRYPDAWDQFSFGLRLGDAPQVIITTTPRATKQLKEIISDPSTVVTKGTTYDNRQNLAKAFYDRVINRYENTRLGRQELLAEILDEVPGALWNRTQIEKLRLKAIPVGVSLSRVVVAVDPAISTNENSNETGIVTVAKGSNDHFYVLTDRSGVHTPEEWAREAVAQFDAQKADRVIGESNQGGDMVERTLRVIRQSLPITLVHASRGKVTRAEPVAALYEQGRVHHIGAFPQLEDQMCQFTSDFDRTKMGYSPDRIDALVWAITDLSERHSSLFTFSKRA